jgi:hypothetical protein
MASGQKTGFWQKEGRLTLFRLKGPLLSMADANFGVMG